MRLLTMFQPWASLLAHGHKLNETRSWRTKYRGPVAINAAKGKAPADWLKPDVVELSEKLLGSKLSELPRGVVVGVAGLMDCRRMGENELIVRQTEQERCLGIWTPLRWAWRMAHAIPFPSDDPEAMVCVGGRQGMPTLALHHEMAVRRVVANEVAEKAVAYPTHAYQLRADVMVECGLQLSPRFNLAVSTCSTFEAERDPAFPMVDLKDIGDGSEYVINAKVFDKFSVRLW